MKKETLFAIILGIGLGVIVAVTLALKNRQSQIQQSKPISTGANISPTPPRNLSVEALDITEPLNGAIVSTNSITIKGKVAKDSLVIIQTPIKTAVIKNSPEKLEVSIPLALGENVIQIVVYPKDANVSTKEKELHIYYLDEQ